MKSKIIFLFTILFCVEIPFTGAAQNDSLVMAGQGDSTVYIQDGNKDAGQAASPVFFSGLSVRKKDKAVSVTWSVESSAGNNYFVIERSKDGKNFEAIGSLKVRNKAACSRLHYLDTKPLEGISYYRVKQINFKKGHCYSESVMLSKKIQ